MMMRDEPVCQGGIVLSKSEDVVRVLIDRNAGCDSCSAKGNCGAMFSEQVEMDIKTDLDLHVGQRVEVGLQPGAILGASALMFLLPAVAFIIGLVAGYSLADYYQWANQQWIGLAFGGVMFLISVIIIRLQSNRMTDSDKYHPYITKIFEDK